MTRSFKVYQGEDESPVYDLTEPDSPVHVIWDEIEAGGRAFQGESTTNGIPMRDERAETGNATNLPVGLTFTSLSRGSRWEWLENVGTSHEVRMAAGRIGTKDYSRGRQKADRAREIVVQCADRNEELTEIIVDDWARSEELDYVRVEALRAAYLDGDPRATTIIADTYISQANGVTLPAKTYDGTNPKDILTEIAQLTNKLFFVTVDDELFYDVPESTIYQAGIRISDRLDELNTEGSCSSSTPVVEATATKDNIDSPIGLTIQVGEQANKALFVGVSGVDGSQVTSVTWYPDFINEGSPGTGESFTAVEQLVVQAGQVVEIWRLLDPSPSTQSTSEIQVVMSAGRVVTGAWLLSGVNQTTPESDSATNSGTGLTSTVTVTPGAEDLVLDVSGFERPHPSFTAVPAPGSHTADWASFENGTPLTQSAAGGGGHGSSGTPTWTINESSDWGAVAVAVAGQSTGSGEDATTFPPIWDVGPASSEDGLELVSGLRLYYGQEGAYVYVNHAGTEAEYWHAERSFYTQDSAIDDSTKATALANAILTRLRFEERSYNVTIGPLNEDQVGCIKYGQLIDIKARPIPDADDLFVSRRIAQLKWTTPRPGVFFAHMQLNRPIKAVPFGIGPKQGHDALEAHKEGDSHPASAIVVTPFGTIAATDVQAALEEIVSEAAGGITVEDEGTPLATVATTLDFVGAGVTATGSGAEKTITIPGGGSGITIEDADASPTLTATKLVFENGTLVDEGSGVASYTAPSGGSGSAWTQDVNEDGSSFANFTANDGTWASNGTIIQQTATPTTTEREAYYNTILPFGLGVVAQADIRLPSSGQGTGANIQAKMIVGENSSAGAVGGLAAVLEFGTTDQIQIERHGQIGLRAINNALSYDTWYTLRLAINGPWASVWLDGTLKGSTIIVSVTQATADRLVLATYNSIVDFRNIKLWRMALPS